MDIKSAACMDNNGKDTNHTRYIDRKVHFVRNGEKWKIYMIEWCEGVLQLAETASKNVGGNDLNPGMKYIMVRLDNW